MKSTFLKLLKWFGIVIGVMVVFGFVLQVVDPEGVKRRAQEARETPPGFTFGFLAGSLYKTKGMRKPSSADVDAMARRSADENNIEHGQRSWYVGNYTQAFWMGWNRAK